MQTATAVPGERLLVHDGWSAVGQAALDVGLALGLTPFTTYRSEEEKELISQRFPQVS